MSRYAGLEKFDVPTVNLVLIFTIISAVIRDVAHWTSIKSGDKLRTETYFVTIILGGGKPSFVKTFLASFAIIEMKKFLPSIEFHTHCVTPECEKKKCPFIFRARKGRDFFFPAPAKLKPIKA